MLMNMSSNYSVNGSSDLLLDAKNFEDYPESLLQFAYACCVIFMLLGIPGNLITIIALVTCKKYRNATAVYIISLHISNLIFCCVVLPLAAVNYAMMRWIFSTVVCEVYALVKFGLIGNMHFTVVAITINRYIMVCHPFMYPRFYKKKNIIISLISTWVTGFAIFLPSFFEIWGRFDVLPKDGVCTMVPDQNKVCPKTLFVSLAFAGPYLIVFSCYGRIWWTLRTITQNNKKHKAAEIQRTSDASVVHNGYVDQLSTASGSSMDTKHREPNDSMILTRTTSQFYKCSFSSKRIKNDPQLPTSKDKKLATMILALLISFVISHLPLLVTRVIYGDNKPNPYAKVFGSLMEYSAAFLSPLVYVIMSNEYRRAYRILFDKIKTNLMKGIR